MYINKNFKFKEVMRFIGIHLIWLHLWMTFVVILYKYFALIWLKIPLSAISVIGVAVAFYIGFKNNQAYDRLWEARKIWGSIVNNSRAWGSMLRSYISNQFRTERLSQQEIDIIIKRIIYRHIAWLYTLRDQLLVPAPWEHINQGLHMEKMIKRRRQSYGLGLLDDDYSEEIKKLLDLHEFDDLLTYSNTATQIIDRQAQELKQLRTDDLIDDFRQMELQKILNDFYVFQGQAERIKKTPLPRQYGSVSIIFVSIFIFLLPFGFISEFDKIGSWGIWLSIPLMSLIGWVFLVMELVGDYSENPFEGLGNDIPMLSLCRGIEIDLREMIKDKNIPQPISPKNGILM